jgi:nucleotide-binding universal stress UspA family protein
LPGIGLGGTAQSTVGPFYGDDSVEDSRAAATIAQAQGVFGDDPRVTYGQASGDPGETIVRLATERKSDVIVLGSHGRNLLQRLLVGSVATYVVNHADCPVFVVREKRLD